MGMLCYDQIILHHGGNIPFMSMTFSFPLFCIYYVIVFLPIIQINHSSLMFTMNTFFVSYIKKYHAENMYKFIYNQTDQVGNYLWFIVIMIQWCSTDLLMRLGDDNIIQTTFLMGFVISWLQTQKERRITCQCHSFEWNAYTSIL